LVGVKNDGTIEGKKIKFDEAKLKVQTIAIKNCSPAVETSLLNRNGKIKRFQNRYHKEDHNGNSCSNEKV